MGIFTRYSILFIICCYSLPFSLQARNAVTQLNQNTSLLFIENKGQVVDQNRNSRKDILFKLDGGAVNIFIGKGALHYQWTKSVGSSQLPESITKTSNSPSTVDIYRLDVTLIGANPDAEVIAEEKQDYYEQYYNELLPDGATVHSFKKLTFKNIYPNIDWEVLLSANPAVGGGLKHNFIVHQGGDYKNIQVRYNGAASLQLKDGALVATTPFGSITEDAPYTYNAETKEKISSSFVLNGNVLSYMIPSITNHQSQIINPLIIDPSLAWSTYYGGPQNEYGLSVTTDLLGNAYLAGQTISSTNVATTGAYQTTISGAEDGFIAKFNVMGQRQWATYYGGPSQDYFKSIAFDGVGYIYAAGPTYSSSGISSIGSHQVVFGGLKDAFLAKFDLNGQRQWATYYGGNNSDESFDVACDKKGGIYLGGRTYSANDIATPGSYRDAYVVYNSFFATNGFLAKFNAAGVRQWGTYHQSDDVASIACDTMGNVYITGTANIDTGVATTHQTTKGDAYDSYLVKFNGSGIKLWGTYYGGTSSDEVLAVTCDVAGNAYIAGYTYSSIGNAISTNNSFISNPGSNDAFVAKFSPVGARAWGTYLGGALDDYIYGIAVAPSGLIYVAGNTNSPGNIATFGAHQTTYGNSVNGGGPNDVFLMTLRTDGSKQYGTYIGGTGNDLCNDLTLSNVAGLYLSATTSSDSSIASPSTIYQYQRSGNNDAFLALFVTDTLFYINQPFTDTLFCQGDSIYVKYSIIPNMPGGTTFTAWLSDSVGSFASPVSIGTYTSQVSGAVPAKIPLTVPPGNGYRVRVTSSSISYPTTDNAVDIRIKETPVKPVLSATPPFCELDTLNLYSATTTTTPGVTYSWTGANGFTSNAHNPVIYDAKANATGIYKLVLELNGCKSEDTLNVKVKSMPVKPKIVHNAPVCEGDTLIFRIEGDTIDVVYTWAWPNPNVIPQQNNIVDKATRDFTGLYTVIANRAGCTQKDTATIVVKPRPVITASSTSPANTNTDLQLFTNTADTVNTMYKWTGPNGFNSTERNPIIKTPSTLATGTYTINASIDGCSSSAITIVVVHQAPADKYLTLFPNPNNGSFTLKGYTNAAQTIDIEVVDMAGKAVFKANFITTSKLVNQPVTLPVGLANGVYFLRIHADNKNTALRFLIGR